MDKPLVSVIVPCYNHEKYIEQCILSIVNQTYTNIQLIVIDDGSKDKSFDVISGLKNKYNFVAEKQQNIGLSKTINKALKQYVEGKYVIIIASDDYMLSDRIEKQVKYFEENQHLGFVFGKAHAVNDEGDILGVFPNVEIQECTFSSLMLINYVPAPCAIIKREVYDVVGIYDEENYIEDWDMWLRIADKYSFNFINEYVACYRTHGTNISRNYIKMAEAKKSILIKWRSHPLYTFANDIILLWELSVMAAKDKRAALSFILKNYRLVKYSSYHKSLIKLFIPSKYLKL